MGATLDRALAARLEEIRTAGLYRQLHELQPRGGARVEIGGRTYVNFSSNDYLGFADHPMVREAAARAARDFGAGSGASRLLTGSLGVHHELERELAAFKQREAALVFSSGYAAALGTVTALLSPEDIVVIDRKLHASLVDAARLSRATLRVYAHNDLAELEKILQWADGRTKRHLLIITETVFSMDGTIAPLQELVTLKNRYGAWLMVDEAHGTGLYGNRRSGVVEEAGVTDQVEIHMGTLSKALGAAGGYICGSRTLVDYLVNRARSLIYSTAPTPAVSAAALASLRLLQSETGAAAHRCAWAHAARLRDILGEKILPGRSIILPIWIGDETRAVAIAEKVKEAGFLLPAIRYPTVARAEARLRLTCTASHRPEALELLARTLLPLLEKTP